MRKPCTSCALLLAFGLALLFATTACRTVTPTPRDAPVVGRVIERGVASWYGKPFHGRQTASGAVYDMHEMTAAHKELAFGTVVEVTNLDNGLSTVVEITDRGPFIRGRVIDLSLAAAREIEMVGPGTAKVELRIVETPHGGQVERVRTANAYGYTVQAGAFQESSRAERLRRQLARRYADVVVRSTDGWFRVHVGEYAERERAERVQQELTRRGFVALIVPLS
ncbi:MAG TPA: septal ring lytic transglycosylase RlpA family protein [Thermoanaerobaculia bacterium]|nr:septal ring lytic transglycosylase RlpA family protein [Thermoanaerobaculia bacterium]